MRIAVLWDGDGQARLILESKGHDCVGFEIRKSQYEKCLEIGSGRCAFANPMSVDLASFDGVWVNSDYEPHRSWAYTTIENRPLWINGEEIK